MKNQGDRSQESGDRMRPAAGRMPPLITFLALVSAIFIGILIYVWVEAKRANPQMLDEQGHVVRTS
jgi:hypothetical protein